jgi:hypothetical protein
MTQQPSKYAKRLDRTRDYGTYCPPEPPAPGTTQGAFYNQDGLDFDHEGYVVEWRLSPEQREKLARKAAPKPPAPAAKPAVAAGDGDEPPTVPNENDDGLNLEMWLRGEEDYPFPDVQKAVRARMNVWKTAKRDLILFLVEEQKLISTDELSAEFKSMVA